LRNVPESLNALDRLERQLSTKRTLEAMEMCAKIAAENTMLNSLILRNMKYCYPEISQRLEKLIEKGDALSEDEVRYAEILEYYIHDQKIRTLSKEDAIDYLMDSIRDSFSLYRNKAQERCFAEKMCLHRFEVQERAGFLANITDRRLQLLEKGDQLSDADKRYVKFLKEYSAEVKKQKNDVTRRNSRLYTVYLKNKLVVFTVIGLSLAALISAILCLLKRGSFQR